MAFSAPAPLPAWLETGRGRMHPLRTRIPCASTPTGCMPGRSPTSVIDAVVQAASRPPDDYSMRMGWVPIALQNAFWQLLHAGSLEQGVVSTVMSGGDTDTNAAIAGALLGAVYGRNAIPLQWLDRILTCRPKRRRARASCQPCRKRLPTVPIRNGRSSTPALHQSDRLPAGRPFRRCNRCRRPCSIGARLDRRASRAAATVSGGC